MPQGGEEPMKKSLFFAALAAVSLAGCAGGAQDKEYNDLAAQAENEIKLANKTGFLWRDTEKFLKESKEAKEAGDTEKAMKQAQLAQQQAKDNANPRTMFSN